jgi:predicted PurR-regulated permease PerM
MRSVEFTKNALEATIRIGLVVLLGMWCFNIIRPFVVLIVWGIIIAVAVHPGHSLLQAMLGRRQGLAAALVTVAMLLIMVWPAVLLGSVLVDNVQMVVARLEGDSLTIPPPPPGVEAWPVVGNALAKFWSLASSNLDAALQQLEPQIQVIGRWLLVAATGTGLGILQFIAAVILAGVLLAYAGGAYRLAQSIGRRLAGERGEGFVDLADATVRSVARGVIGVALIQSLLAGLGLVVAGVPAAGLWTLLCLVLAIVQIGVLPIMLPAVIYVFSTTETLPAVLFLIWAVVVTVSDNVLKPLLLGRGVDVPTVVILVGAIGGLLLDGIIGLFVGAVVLALGYKLFLAWLEADGLATEAGDEAE